MSKHALAGVLNDRHRHIITAVVEEVSAKGAKSGVALQLMPIVDVPAAVLEHEIISAYGGLTGERALNASGKPISGPSSYSKVYEPGFYQESILFTENDLLRLRKLGTIGDRGVTGLTGGELNWIDRAAKKLKLRMENRLHKLAWDAIFTGQYSFGGAVKYSFGIPGANALTAATAWSTPSVGKPFEDLLVLLKTSPVLRKYQGMIKALVINPNTEAVMIQRALEAKYITNNNVMNADINEIAKFAAPGLPKIEVVNDVWQDETVSAAGVVTLGDAQFMVPDNKVLVVIDFNKGDVLFPEYGQLQLTENMNAPGATVERPATGLYTFVDEKGLEQRKSPFVELVSGFNGGPNLMRPFDVFTISFS